jgi:hypothetical protein
MGCSYCVTASAVGEGILSCPCDEDLELPSCEVCGGDLGLLGFLGRRAHYQCRACGAEHSRVLGPALSERES